MSTCSDPDRPDTDDENSQRSYSNASSPSGSLQQTPNYVSLYLAHQSFAFLTQFSRLSRFSRPPEVRSSLFRIPLSRCPEHSPVEAHPRPPRAPGTRPPPQWRGSSWLPGASRPRPRARGCRRVTSNRSPPPPRPRGPPTPGTSGTRSRTLAAGYKQNMGIIYQLEKSLPKHVQNGSYELDSDKSNRLCVTFIGFKLYKASKAEILSKSVNSEFITQENATHSFRWLKIDQFSKTTSLLKLRKYYIVISKPLWWNIYV